MCYDLDSTDDVERRAVNDMKSKCLLSGELLWLMTLILPVLYTIIYYQNPASMPFMAAIMYIDDDI